MAKKIGKVREFCQSGKVGTLYFCHPSYFIHELLLIPFQDVF